MNKYEEKLIGLWRDKIDGEIVLLIGSTIHPDAGSSDGYQLLRPDLGLDWVRTDVLKTYYEKIDDVGR